MTVRVHSLTMQAGMYVCCTQLTYSNAYESLCTSVDMGQVVMHTCQHWYKAGMSWLVC